MNSGGSNNLSLKYERYASSGCWDLGIIKLGFVAKTQFPFARIQIYIEKTKIWTKYKEGSLQNFRLFCSSKARNLKYMTFSFLLFRTKKNLWTYLLELKIAHRFYPLMKPPLHYLSDLYIYQDLRDFRSGLLCPHTTGGKTQLATGRLQLGISYLKTKIIKDHQKIVKDSSYLKNKLIW